MNSTANATTTIKPTMQHKQLNSIIFALEKFERALKTKRIADDFDQIEEVKQGIDSLTEMLYQLNDGNQVTISPDQAIVKEIQIDKQRIKQIKQMTAQEAKLKPGIYKYEDSDQIVWTEYDQEELMVQNGWWQIKQREDGTPYSPDSNRNLKFIMETPSETEVLKQLSGLGIRTDLKSQARNYNSVLIAARRIMKKN